MRQFFTTILILFYIVSFAQLDTKNLIIKARLDIYNNNYTEALKIFNSIINVKPELVEPYFYRGVIKYQRNDMLGAEKDLQKTISMNPYYTSAYHYLSIVKSSQLDFNLAIIYINKALELSPYNASMFLTKGIIYLQMQETKLAITNFNEAEKLNNQLPEIYLNIGVAYLIEKKYNNALKNLDKAIKLNVFFADAYARKAIVYLDKNELDSALTQINYAIKLDKKKSLYYYWRANIKYKKPDFDGTIKDYDKVIELNPENTLAYYNRGIIKTEIGLYNDAIDDYTKVNELEPNNLLAYYNKGTIYYNQKNYKNLLIEMDKAIEIYPEFSQAYKLRSIAKENIGDKKGAFKDKYIANQLTNNQSIIDTNKFNKIISFNDNFNIGFSKNKSTTAFNNIEYRIVKTDENQTDFLKNYSYTDIDDLNTFLPKGYIIILTDIKSTLTEDEQHNIFEYLNNTTIDSKNYVSFLKSVINIELKNYKSAKLELEKLSNTNFFPAKFTSAILEERLSEFNNNITTTSNIININGVDSKYESKNNQISTNYNSIIENYSKLDKNNAIVNYNLGNIYNTKGEYYTSTHYYSKCINTDKEFAYAYFNRGKTYIILKEINNACADFSKSGELGIEKSYKLINKYCNNSKE